VGFAPDKSGNTASILIVLYNFSVLEISAGDYGDHNEALVAAIQNGKCNDWRRRQTDRSSFSYHGKPASYPWVNIM